MNDHSLVVAPESLSSEEIALLFSKLTKDILDPNAAIDLTTLQKCLTIILARIESAKHSSSIFTVSDDSLKLFLQFNVEINLHYKRTRSVSDYSKKLGLTSRKLTFICNRFAGRSAKEMINDQLIIQSKQKLSVTDSALKNLSVDLGFTDQYQFSAFFKRYTNESPTDFRKKLIQQKLYAHSEKKEA